MKLKIEEIKVRSVLSKTGNALKYWRYINSLIGPVLPMNPESLANQIKPYVGSIIIDRMNYVNKVKWLYEKSHIEKWLEEEFIEEIISRLRKSFSGETNRLWWS